MVIYLFMKLVIAETIAILFIFIAQKGSVLDIKTVIKGAPWNIVLFSIGMYVVVYGVGDAGLTSALARGIEYVAQEGLFIGTVSMGFISALPSLIMNNMLRVMIV